MKWYSHVLRNSGLVCLLVTMCLALVLPASAQVGLTQLSQDTFTDNASQHATEVEPGVFTYGSTIVTGFQVARIYSGGGADIGFATSKDGGATWTNGYLPGLTIYQGGSYQAASDAAVAYDALHGVWLMSTLPIGNTSMTVAVSRSSDGITWSNPVFLNNSPSADKNWIVCDNTATSKYYGHCYQEWDDPSQGDLLLMSVSTDGGITWGPAQHTLGYDYGIGGVPVVKNNGKVIVPFLGFNGYVQAFWSTNGGKTWARAVNVAEFINHYENGDIRSAGLPSSGIDAAGNVWVAWSDCRYRTNCAENDIVYSTSGGGAIWKPVQRVPIDPTTSTVDHFITGMAIQPGTKGAKTHVAIDYYYYPTSNCGNCQLYVGFIESYNKGKTWTNPVTLGGPMDLTWLPDTFSGRMVADYIGVGFGTGGKAFPIFALAAAPVGNLFSQAIFTATGGLAPAGAEGEQVSAADDQPVPDAHSDHGPMEYYDQEHQIPVGGQRPPEGRE